jgi:hypothetical protein
MKGLIRHLTLLGAAALLFPESGIAEQPQGVAAADVRAPNTVVCTAPTRDSVRMPSRPGVMPPMIEAGGETTRNVGAGGPGSLEITKENDADIEAIGDEGAFLRPTWDRGFWVMPPGGLTRFLLPAPGFINPEETLQQPGGAVL